MWSGSSTAADEEQHTGKKGSKPWYPGDDNGRITQMQALNVYCQQALEVGFDGGKIIDPRSITTAEWVRMKCQFGCSGFGMRLCCSPHTPTPETTRKVLDGYERAVLLHKTLRVGERGKGSLGFKGFKSDGRNRRR